MHSEKNLRWALRCFYICCLMLVLTVAVFLWSVIDSTHPAPALQAKEMTNQPPRPELLWSAPDSTLIPNDENGDLVRYGRELVAHTAKYLGPMGSVARISNGMNCQNCHLQAGKKIFGNNYSAVASTYPKLRARSGTIETVDKRINDCLQRSLNGKPLDTTSREMKALRAYILWVGSAVEKGKVPKGSGLLQPALLDRPADPAKGEIVFAEYCVSCHGADGRGVRAEDGTEWKYPPLHGENSFNTAAGLYRISRMAGYVKANMPNGATFENPVLTDEQAWDVAAYINSLSRPYVIFPQDWPDISKKPMDHPFGPYADKFTEAEHKYGPFQKMLNQ